MGGGPGQLSLVTGIAAVGMVASTLLGLLALTDSLQMWHLRSYRSPALAIIVSAVASLLSGIFYLLMRPTQPRDEARPKAELIRGTLTDIGEGFVYMWRTSWLLAILLFAMLMVLMVMGPLEVLVPFVVKERAGGDAGSHAMVLAAFGIGGAAGSLMLMEPMPMPMPRRYLTVMFVIWVCRLCSRW